MRMVGSRVLLNQMRGRAVRTMDDNGFWKVTPGAAEKGQTKDYSVLIDAVGLTDEDVVLAEASPTTGDPTVPLRNLLRDIGMGLTDDENLKSAALRLVRLNNKLSDSERDEFSHVANGSRMTEVIEDLRNAASPDLQLAAARAQTGKDDQTDAEVAAARDALVVSAITQLRRPEVRQKLESLQMTVSEQLIHIGGHDELVSAGFLQNPDEAKTVLDAWRSFIEDPEHQDEYVALKAYYAQPFRRRPSLKDIKKLPCTLTSMTSSPGSLPRMVVPRTLQRSRTVSLFPGMAAPLANVHGLRSRPVRRRGGASALSDAPLRTVIALGSRAIVTY